MFTERLCWVATAAHECIAYPDSKACWWADKLQCFFCQISAYKDGVRLHNFATQPHPPWPNATALMHDTCKLQASRFCNRLLALTACRSHTYLPLQVQQWDRCQSRLMLGTWTSSATALEVKPHSSLMQFTEPKLATLSAILSAKHTCWTTVATAALALHGNRTQHTDSGKSMALYSCNTAKLKLSTHHSMSTLKAWNSAKGSCVRTYTLMGWIAHHCLYTWWSQQQPESLPRACYLSVFLWRALVSNFGGQAVHSLQAALWSVVCVTS